MYTLIISLQIETTDLVCFGIPEDNTLVWSTGFVECVDNSVSKVTPLKAERERNLSSYFVIILFSN